MSLETIAASKAFGGLPGVYKHASATTGIDMTFSVYVPSHLPGDRPPLVWYLSRLACTHANVTERAEYRMASAELGLIFAAADTSPRGENVSDDPATAYDFGLGAGFYVDATEAPYATHYRTWSYVCEELPALIAANFPADPSRQSITGHSMGGHGALTIGLTFRITAVSTFAPIVAPTQVAWGKKALSGYLGDDCSRLLRHDAVALIEDRAHVPELLVDQCGADKFLEKQLRPELLEQACAKAGIDPAMQIRDDYDHSYFLISTFTADHLRWRAGRLQ